MSGRSEEQALVSSRGRPEGLPKRWSAQRKTEVVLRLLRGEDIGEVSREVRVAPPELERWRRVFLDGGQQGLKGKNRARGELMRTRAKLGEMTMRVELQAELLEKRGYGGELRNLLSPLVQKTGTTTRSTTGGSAGPSRTTCSTLSSRYKGGWRSTSLDFGTRRLTSGRWLTNLFQDRTWSPGSRAWNSTPRPKHLARGRRVLEEYPGALQAAGGNHRPGASRVDRRWHHRIRDGRGTVGTRSRSLIGLSSPCRRYDDAPLMV